MFLSIHEPITTNVSNFIDALKTGSSTALLGMIIVFAVLTVIFVALVIMRKVLTRKDKKKITEVSAPAPVVKNEPVEEEAPVAEEAPADNGAIIAAIMAAISAHTGKPLTSFRVVSFKRRH